MPGPASLPEMGLNLLRRRFGLVAGTSGQACYVVGSASLLEPAAKHASLLGPVARLELGSCTRSVERASRQRRCWKRSSGGEPVLASVVAGPAVGLGSVLELAFEPEPVAGTSARARLPKPRPALMLELELRSQCRTPEVRTCA
ncbi:hypothetical protein ACFPN7_36800 [Amycolatopsis halotolerans]|uniref:hypothetical protein n=1 Tax=Amycolatopsis halotolerans TaxID=330083 RepID=UPI00361B7709